MNEVHWIFVDARMVIWACSGVSCAICTLVTCVQGHAAGSSCTVAEALCCQALGEGQCVHQQLAGLQGRGAEQPGPAALRWQAQACRALR